MSWGQVLRLLSLMDALVSQRACKSATLHLLSGSVSGDEQLADLFPLLLSLLAPPAGHSLQQQQCSVLVGTVLQSLCDQVRSATGITQNCLRGEQEENPNHLFFIRTYLSWCLHLVKTVCLRLNSWLMHFQDER